MAEPKKKEEFRRPPYRIDPWNNLNDLRVFVLAVGSPYYGHHIGKLTNYTPGQVSYRMKKFGLSMKEIRTGTNQYSYLSKSVVKEAEATITRQAMSILKKQFKAVKKPK